MGYATGPHKDYSNQNPGPFCNKAIAKVPEEGQVKTVQGNAEHWGWHATYNHHNKDGIDHERPRTPTFMWIAGLAKYLQEVCPDGAEQEART